MRRPFKIATFLTFLISCLSATDKIEPSTEIVDYGRLIQEYLQSKAIEPTVVFINDGREKFDLLDHKIVWREVERGVEITVDGYTFTTSDKVTTNTPWDSGVDSVHFANFLRQVKIYEYDSLIGFVLAFDPCTGLACGVDYQIIYDLKTQKQTYFGHFWTGYEFELYNFNSDSKPDFLAKTCFCRNASRINATEYVLYSQTDKGDFEVFETPEQKKFWFKYTYSELDDDSEKESFEESWVEKISEENR